MQSKKTSVMTTPKCPGAQIWQIYLPGTDILWSRMAISRSAGRSTPLVLTSSGPELQFHIATDI